MKTLYSMLFFALFHFGIAVQSRVLIKNANVWDGTSNQLTSNVSVLIENNLIKKVAKNIEEPTGATIIDGST